METTLRPSTLDDLVGATDKFMELHWSEVHGSPPRWDRWETFLQGAVPNYLHAGCYAIFVGSELIYLGLGASKGGGLYKDRGISRRLMGHVIRSDRESEPGWYKLTETWQSATALYTIGFKDASYLAAALETYLIRLLNPPRNSRI